MVIHYNGKLATMPCSTPVAFNQGRDFRPKYTITEEDVDNYLIRAALSNRQRDIITAPDVGPPDHPEHQTSDVIGVVTTSRKHPEPFQGCKKAGHPSSKQRKLP